MVTCWERADLLALVGDVYCIFVTFPCGTLRQVWYLIVLFPTLCRLSYFYFQTNFDNIMVYLLSPHFLSPTDKDWGCYRDQPGICPSLCLFLPKYFGVLQI